MGRETDEGWGREGWGREGREVRVWWGAGGERERGDGGGEGGIEERGREEGREGEMGMRQRKRVGLVSHHQILIAVTVLETRWRSEHFHTPADKQNIRNAYRIL